MEGFHLTLCLCQVSDLLGRYPDDMEAFNEFLAYCEKHGNNFNQMLMVPSINLQNLI